MRTLVIGAAGQVGKALCSVCEAKGFEVYKTSRRTPGMIPVDLADPLSIKAAFKTARPELVFLCSAMTNVDGCERDPELARLINVEGTRTVVAEAAALHAKLVYISTEYVFDGSFGPYDEDAPVNPINVYGRTKLEAERLSLTLPGALSIRTTVVYSYAPGTKNFLMQLVENHRTATRMRVPVDQYSNPTHAPDMAAAVFLLVEKGATGIYNVVGPDWINRYEFALMACKAFGFSDEFIESRTTAETGQTARRPLKAGLKTTKLVSAIGHALPPLTQSLKTISECLSSEIVR